MKTTLEYESPCVRVIYSNDGSSTIEVSPIAIEAVEAGVLSRAKSFKLVAEVELTEARSGSSAGISYKEWIARDVNAHLKVAALDPLRGVESAVVNAALFLARSGSAVLWTFPNEESADKARDYAFTFAQLRRIGQVELRDKSRTLAFSSIADSSITFCAPSHQLPPLRFDYWFETT
jgi:hypothetical protein